MTPGIGLLDLASGALIVLGIFAAFMVWAVFPLVPFFLIGAVYAGFRHGLPALGRAAVAVEHGTVQAIRWALFPVAVWAIRGPVPVHAQRGDGRGRG